MAKPKDKKLKMSGALTSATTGFPEPIGTQNSPTDGEIGFSDKARILRNSKTNQKM